ncbi:MAG TPA: PAS domain-containing protein [Rariglobus sp.]
MSEADLLRTRLETSQRIATIGDWERDERNGVIHCSTEVYAILGVTHGNPGAVAETFAASVHPDDRDSVRQRMEILCPALRRICFDHRIIRPDGQIRHVQQRAELLIDVPGAPAHVIGTIQDITVQKEAEASLRASQERFKLVAKTIGDVIWDWNLLSGAIWRSDGFENTFGLAASEADELQTTWDQLIHADDRARIVASLNAVIAGPAHTWTEEYRVLRRDGTYAVVEDRAQIVRDADGTAVRMVGGVRDLTEHKNFEARLLRSQRMESIGVLAGGIAHDLNNILAPILMSIDILKQDSRGKEHAHRMLEIVRASAQRGADLVRQVLTFSRGADGEYVAVSFRHLFNELECIVKETFPRSIEIEFNAASSLWPVMGDASQLHQVLLNLAVNARDAMPQGGKLAFAATNKTVDAAFPGIEADTPPGSYVELVVTDTGTGMTPEVRERIFEAFFTTKGAGKGTGLGLASVHAIVRKYRGFVNVTSAAGEGTVFKIYFPVDPSMKSDSRPPMMIENQRGKGETVLLVDDERSIRDIAQQTLESFGYRVLVAGDGIEGIALYVRNSGTIGVVITDMLMPNCDGLSMIRALLGINSEVRIIAASGQGIDPEAVNGVSDFLAKPYSAEAMLKLIRAVLDRP